MTIKEKIINRLANTDRRSAKMHQNTLAMLIIRGLSIFISLLSAPIMLKHVDRVDYGVLLTLTSLASWIGLMDIGLGNGLRNKLSEYLAEGNKYKAREAVSSCYAALCLCVMALIIFFLIISPFCNWLEILNSPESDSNEIRKLTNVVFIAFCFQFLFGLISSVLFAYQMPAFNSIFSFVGQLLAFIALVLQVYVFHVSSVFQIGSVNCLIPPLVFFIGSIHLFRGKFKEICPSFRFANLKSVKDILSLGLKFFVLQIITIVLFQANTIIIAQAVGPEAVVEYNLAFKYISVITIVFNIILAPIWSATTDAYVRSDFEWIKKTLRYVKKICLLMMGLGAVMFIVSPFVYDFWFGKGVVDIKYTTTGLILLYIYFEILYKVYGTIINGTGKVYAQIAITSVIAVCYIPLAYLSGKTIGLKGVLLVNVVVFFLNYIWSKIQCHKLIMQTASGIWNK